MAKVLIVDDEKALVELIASVVEELGHEPLCAYNGAEGLNLARNQKPGIIFCDIMMPIMNGYDLLREIRLDHSLIKTPVIMMSAARIDRHKAAQADGYLSKPFDLDRIAHYIDSLPA